MGGIVLGRSDGFEMLRSASWERGGSLLRAR
jgi:hypothetical protein